jgi:sec-independent protein translocase protein TatA
MDLSPGLIWVVVLLILLFGPSKLPDLAKGVGQAAKEFKKAFRESDDESHGTPQAAAPPPPPQPISHEAPRQVEVSQSVLENHTQS